MFTKPITIAAVLVALLSVSTASAQDAAAETRAPLVTVELQARLGAGVMFTNLEDGQTLPATSDGGSAGNGTLGASVGVRHSGVGLGVVAAYTHSFTGVVSHYGAHTYEGRLSERLTLHRDRRFELSLLLEAGAYYLEGGAVGNCTRSWFTGNSSTCTTTRTSLTGVGAVGAVGLMFRHDAVLGGLEVDYRHTEGVSGPLDSEDDILVLARIGVVFDI